MLIELHISDFAIIEQLDLQFQPGLTTFTGETGAGKSIIIDAVETILGGRAEMTMVRGGSERALIEGVFRISNNTRGIVHKILQNQQLLDDPELVTMTREIRLNGPNVARINGRIVNAGLLREIGEYLIDVHGQSEHLSLLRVRHHLELLDNFAGTNQDLAVTDIYRAYRKVFHELMKVTSELERLRQSERDAARQADMFNYQIKEIQAANLQPDEEQNLLDERNRLANAESLATLVQGSLLALDEGSPESPSIIELLGQVVHSLSGLVRLDTTQSDLLERAQAAFAELNDLSGTLRSYLDEIEFNPKRLDRVEGRLALIENLKRKYGNSIPEILDYLAKARRELAEIEGAEEKIGELELESGELLRELGEIGWELSKRRQVAARNLSSAIESELNDLNMSAARFEVDFQYKDDPNGAPVEDNKHLAFGPHGLERVEFLIAPNPGEGLKPLTKIASGGETSRLMLALKNVLAKADQIPCLIFDEIDQGIGGRVGTIVGEKLWSLARNHQVFCITHLPQLAAFGDQHYHVQKKIVGGRTTTQVEVLKGEKRTLELAQMMGEISEGTLHSARELSDLVNKKTRNLS